MEGSVLCLLRNLYYKVVESINAQSYCIIFSAGTCGTDINCSSDRACSDHVAGRSLITCLSYGDHVTERR